MLSKKQIDAILSSLVADGLSPFMIKCIRSGCLALSLFVIPQFSIAQRYVDLVLSVLWADKNYGAIHQADAGVSYCSYVANPADGYIPTAEAWDELRDNDNCAWTWVQRKDSKGHVVWGYKIASRKKGFENNSIFLACVGYKEIFRYGQPEVVEFGGMKTVKTQKTLPDGTIVESVKTISPDAPNDFDPYGDFGSQYNYYEETVKFHPRSGAYLVASEEIAEFLSVEKSGIGQRELYVGSWHYDICGSIRLVKSR